MVNLVLVPVTKDEDGYIKMKEKDFFEFANNMYEQGKKDFVEEKKSYLNKVGAVKC